MSYRNTLQADALKLVAKKLQSSLAVEGELPEEGLAAYGDDGDDGILRDVNKESVTRRYATAALLFDVHTTAWHPQDL